MTQLTGDEKQMLEPVPERDEPPCESMVAELQLRIKDMETSATQEVTAENLRESMTAMFETVIGDMEAALSALSRDGK